MSCEKFNQPTNQPTNQTTNQPTSQPASQPANQPTNGSEPVFTVKPLNIHLQNQACALVGQGHHTQQPCLGQDINPKPPNLTGQGMARGSRVWEQDINPKPPNLTGQGMARGSRVWGQDLCVGGRQLDLGNRGGDDSPPSFSPRLSLVISLTVSRYVSRCVCVLVRTFDGYGAVSYASPDFWASPTQI